MRKYQQKQLLELTQTLAEANAELESLFSCGDFDAVMQLLVDCQGFVVQMGEFIEATEGKGTRTVTLLEECHDDLYNVSIEMVDGTAKPNATKRLRKKIIAIETSIKTELKANKIEIVFFPYKASMWDSFESVWFAAKDDPHCDVYVVPIPYYDKLPGGALGQMRYEGGEYPEYVPVVDWNEYDMEEQHPDIVFVHNPYDNHNHVTSVHPSYYSSELKKHTDFLAYIDYGLPIWQYLTPEKADLLPALYIYDLFFVYSEEYAGNMRYNLKPDRKLRRAAAQRDNVAALGSPKIDAVINTSREGYVLPDSWASLIEGKKILLFSTSLSAVFQGGENFIVGQRETFEALRGRGDIVLWWRPHPLSETTFASTRPQLLEEYNKIVGEYRAEGWGIYDDTPELHRAIAWSDACYSDESSLLLLYLATGKPFVVREFSHKPENHVTDLSLDFTPILETRIKSMQSARGANVFGGNYTIWWHNFVDGDFVNDISYGNFMDRFIHFILNEADYPDAELYRQLKLEMLHEFVKNPDGTAGKKIYEFAKKKYIGVDGI